MTLMSSYHRYSWCGGVKFWASKNIMMPFGYIVMFLVCAHQEDQQEINALHGTHEDWDEVINKPEDKTYLYNMGDS